MSLWEHTTRYLEKTMRYDFSDVLIITVLCLFMPVMIPVIACIAAYVVITGSRAERLEGTEED